jgi:hypothetical protein
MGGIKKLGSFSNAGEHFFRQKRGVVAGARSSKSTKEITRFKWLNPPNYFFTCVGRTFAG